MAKCYCPCDRFQVGVGKPCPPANSIATTFEVDKSSPGNSNMWIAWTEIPFSILKLGVEWCCQSHSIYHCIKHNRSWKWDTKADNAKFGSKQQLLLQRKSSCIFELLRIDGKLSSTFWWLRIGGGYTENSKRVLKISIYLQWLDHKGIQ